MTFSGTKSQARFRRSVARVDSQWRSPTCVAELVLQQVRGPWWQKGIYNSKYFPERGEKNDELLLRNPKG